MKSNWQTKTLDSLISDGVIQLTRGKVISKKDLNAHPGDYPVYSSAKDNEGMFGKYGKYMFDEELITWSVDGGGRLFHRRKHKYSVTNVGGILRILKRDVLDYRYLFYILTYLHSRVIFDWVKKAHPSVIRKIYNQIPLPPISEQKRIVKILDEVFEKTAMARENTEKNLQNSRELFESYLNGVFANPGKNWQEKKLGEVCGFTQGIQKDVGFQSEKQKDNQVRFLRIVDFTQGNEPPRYIDNPGKKYILDENDISLVRYGASTGFVCRGLSGVLANNLFRVIPKSIKEVSNDFLFVFLKSPVFQNVIKKIMGGMAMPAISFSLIKDIPFPVAPIKEQCNIVKKLDSLSEHTKKLEKNYQQKLDDLGELKKSVLSKAFAQAL